MSTRSVIARKTPSGFTGVYHHWDGYPSGLGAGLFELRNGHFKGDTGKMLETLIDSHPAGWSTINGADFTQEPGFGGAETRPHCYCHGDRKERANKLTQANAGGCGCEYAYVFNGDKMAIYSSYCKSGKMIGAFGCGDPDSQWYLLAIVDLNAPAPDWDKVNEMEPILAPEIN